MKTALKNYRPALISKGKEWFVYYYFKNPASGKFDMHRDRGGLNYKELRDNKKERTKEANTLRDFYNDKLKAGWNPYEVTEIEADKYDEIRQMPVAMALEQMYLLKKNAIKVRTWQSYKYSLDVFAKWLKANGYATLKTADVKPSHLVKFFDSLVSEGKFKGKSINNHAGNLGVLFTMLVDREVIVKSPLKVIEKQPEESGKNFPFSEKQKQKLKEVILANDPDLWLFVKCIYHLFVRPIELLKVKIIDVDFRTNHIIIHSGYGKNKKQLPVAIPATFLDELKALKLDQYPEDWYLFGKARMIGGGKNKHKLGPSNSSYGRNSLTARHTAMMKKAGITDPDYSMYGWKHTGNIDSYNAGVDILDLMKQNRHHSIDQTMTYLRSLGLRPNINYSSKAPAL